MNIKAETGSCINGHRHLPWTPKGPRQSRQFANEYDNNCHIVFRLLLSTVTNVAS